MKTKPLPLYKTKPKTIAEAKRRVIGLLKRGWFQGKYSNGVLHSPLDCDATKVCLLGAIARTLDDRLGGRISRRLIKESGKAVGIAGWNDSRDRKLSEVIALVRRA